VETLQTRGKCNSLLLTTGEAAWCMILALSVSVCLSVCMYVCLSDKTFEGRGRPQDFY